MKKRRQDTIGLGAGFGPFGLGFMTWLGLALVVVGWILLLGGAVITALFAARFRQFDGTSLRADVADVAKSVIVTGFGVSIVGALHTGFGTLNRFFGAVLLRSAQRDSETPQPMESAPPPPMATGAKRRPYRMFADGSVEVDTIVGTRLFKTMAEAREFI